MTEKVRASGLAAKIGPGVLEEVIKSLPVKAHPDLLVGMETSDDAGVFRLDSKTALVQTLDFFTPIVDSPYEFGRIAATNSLSDVYAMGGRPLTAMNMVISLPEKRAKECLDALRNEGVFASIIGEVSEDDNAGHVKILP